MDLSPSQRRTFVYWEPQEALNELAEITGKPISRLTERVIIPEKYWAKWVRTFNSIVEQHNQVIVDTEGNMHPWYTPEGVARHWVTCFLAEGVEIRISTKCRRPFEGKEVRGKGGFLKWQKTKFAPVEMEDVRGVTVIYSPKVPPLPVRFS